MGALTVSVYDSAHALTPPSAGLTVPWIEPSLSAAKASNPAETTETIAIRNKVTFITWYLQEFAKISCQPPVTRLCRPLNAIRRPPSRHPSPFFTPSVVPLQAAGTGRYTAAVPAGNG